MVGCPFHQNGPSDAPRDSTALALAGSRPERDRLPITHGPLSDFAADPVVCMRRLQTENGPIAALEENGRRAYFVFDPDANRQVLTDSKRFHSRFFAVRGPKKSAHRRLTSGLLSMNGAEHKEHRRLIMEPFQRRSITGYFDDIVHVTEGLMKQWEFGGSEPRDINADMTAYMLRLTCTILFGLDNTELAYRVGEQTERWVHLNHKIGPAAFSPDPALTSCYDELLESAEDLEVSLKEMIAAKRDGGLGHDVLSLLLQACDEEGMTDDHLVGHMALLFGAAHLTSAHTLTWTMFLLAQHPQVRQEIADELDQVLSQSTPGRRAPTVDDLESFPVLDRVIKESMRVLPASAYSQRMTVKNVELGPFKLPAGVPVMFSPFMTHHLPSIYPDHDVFRPDRWKTITPGPYEYMPFGGGARRCIGAPLAMMQFMTSIPNMLSRFQMTMVRDSQVDARVVSTMLNPTSSVMMRVEPDRGDYSAQPVSGTIHNLVQVPASSSRQMKAS